MFFRKLTVGRVPVIYHNTHINSPCAGFLFSPCLPHFSLELPESIPQIKDLHSTPVLGSVCMSIVEWREMAERKVGMTQSIHVACEE